MFVMVVGAGRVGYYLTKELLLSGHEVVLIEKDPARAAQVAGDLGSIVVNRDGCEGRDLESAGANRADVVVAVTGDDEDNLVVCQMAKHHFNVPRTIARVDNPKNGELFRQLGVNDVISATRSALAAIEQDIPVHELLHLAQLQHGDLEVVEAQITEDSPAVGKVARQLALPDGCIVFALIREDALQVLRSDTVLKPGDKIVALSRTECQEDVQRLFIGESQGEEGEA
jgi:trk system potassium uptake protein TrkA